MVPPNCPHCDTSEAQVRAGKTKAGSQKWLCKVCQRRYTPQPKPLGLPRELHRTAIEMYVDGTSFRAIARRLRVNHQTVINWIDAYAARVPDKPPIAAGPVETAELDEQFTFVRHKKTKRSS